MYTVSYSCTISICFRVCGKSADLPVPEMPLLKRPYSYFESSSEVIEICKGMLFTLHGEKGTLSLMGKIASCTYVGPSLVLLILSGPLQARGL